MGREAINWLNRQRIRVGVNVENMNLTPISHGPHASYGSCTEDECVFVWCRHLDVRQDVLPVNFESLGNKYTRGIHTDRLGDFDGGLDRHVCRMADGEEATSVGGYMSSSSSSSPLLSVLIVTVVQIQGSTGTADPPKWNSPRSLEPHRVCGFVHMHRPQLRDHDLQFTRADFTTSDITNTGETIGNMLVGVWLPLCSYRFMRRSAIDPHACSCHLQVL